jgi:hypothetical protein
MWPPAATALASQPYLSASALLHANVLRQWRLSCVSSFYNKIIQHQLLPFPLLLLLLL